MVHKLTTDQVTFVQIQAMEYYGVSGEERDISFDLNTAVTVLEFPYIYEELHLLKTENGR